MPEMETKGGDLAIIVITSMIFAIFVVGLASVCYRWSSRQFYLPEHSLNQFTDSDDEFRTARRTRRNTATRGIDAAIVKSFPTFLYSEVKERRIGKGGVECAVCLCEFEDDETLRLMPHCYHVFHADCVNVWLSDHSTCPLCRMDLIFQSVEGSDLVSDSDPDPEQRVPGSNAYLLNGVTWSNRNKPCRSKSTRLSHCRVSEIILFSRSHSTGHDVVQPVENIDRFTLRLPEDVRKKLTKNTVGHVAQTQVRSSWRGYRSRSLGGERTVFSDKENNYNNRRMHSMTFSFSGCVESTSGEGDTVAPPKSLPKSVDSSKRSIQLLQPDDRV
ncbi:unnamed protein product [Thlaspi arvense]|uniref:RING-type E3 ubiquitin transferase n=1 Tax=Thlaspi arvense TaxID=13288 RepID=A0AAU9S6N7_THLAR|nr:unnamed protein product [Thlaspi arvense]